MTTPARPGPFRLGLIGAGRMGRTHLRALAGSSQVAITAIAEVSAQARSALAGFRDAGVELYASTADLFAGATIDGVLIAAPTDQHVGLIAEAADRGLPILCEKPCGLTVGDAATAAGAAAAAGVPLQIAYWRRFVPGLRRLRERITTGELGAIHLVACYQWDESPPSDEFRAHSGGIAIDMGVHEFDLLRWLTGQEITSVCAVAAAVEPAAAPDGLVDVDSAQALATLSGGSAGLVSLGRHHPVGDAVWAEAFGTHGSVRCDVIDPADGERAQPLALREQAEGFAAFAAGGPRAGASGEDAVAALAAAELMTAAIPALTGAGGRDGR